MEMTAAGTVPKRKLALSDQWQLVWKNSGKKAGINKQLNHNSVRVQNVEMAYWFFFCQFSELQTVSTNVYFQIFLFIEFFLEIT